MREIKAIIEPAMLARVIEALKGIADLPAVSASEVKGLGKSRAEEA
jgi:nitrogen regulatory protein PII